MNNWSSRLVEAMCEIIVPVIDGIEELLETLHNVNISDFVKAIVEFDKCDNARDQRDNMEL